MIYYPQHPDPRQMQVSLIGFLESSTPTFMAELWTLLLSAQESVGGIPREFVEKKKEEMRLAREKDQAAIRASGIRVGNRFEADSRQALPPRPSASGSRRDFKDKRGNHTSRVQDSGWGSRARVPVGGDEPEEDRYSYRRRVDEDDHYRRSRYNDRESYHTRRDDDRVYERPPRRDRYAERQQRQRNDNHGDNDAYRYPRRIYSRSRSPESYSRSRSPERQTRKSAAHSRRSRSPTPVRSRRDTRTRSYTRSISRSRSRSRTPLTSSSYSRSPSPRPRQRASPANNRRYRNTPSRSRSPTRSISRSISPSIRSSEE